MSAQVLAFRSAANDASNEVEQPSAAGMFSEYMLMELVLEVARSSHDPHGRLAEMFDRITARARAGGVDRQSVMTQFRRHAESFFMLAAKNV